MARRISCLVYLFFGLCVACAAPETSELAPPQSHPIQLEATETFTMIASNQRHYRIQVRYPASYQHQPAKSYPAILKIDGQWDFPLASSVVNNIYFDGQMPEVLVIGVDWVDTSPNIQAVRLRDLSTSAVEGVVDSGQAEAFVNLLADDILPSLAQRLRISEQVYLLGGSLGGDFAAFALFKRPDAFSGAIAIGGTHANSKAIYQQLFKAHRDTDALSNKRLYLGVGDADAVAADVIEFFENIKSAQLDGLQLELDTQPGYGHSGMNVLGYAAGYKYVFDRPKLNLSASQLNKLVGIYAAIDDAGMFLDIRSSAQSLIVMQHGQELRLNAKSPTEFYADGQFFNLLFTIDDNPIGLQVETFFGARDYSRNE